MQKRRNRAIAAVAIASLVAVTIATTLAVAGDYDDYLWQVGDGQGSVGVSNATGSMEINAASDLNVTAGHLRMVTSDGNFEFEHSKGTSSTLLNSYYLGTPTRTPIEVGGFADGQDIVSLIVRGVQGQKNDLEQWNSSGKVVSAIDARGRLRIGGVSLTTRVVKGKAELLAVLPNGKMELLAAAR